MTNKLLSPEAEAKLKRWAVSSLKSVSLANYEHLLALLDALPEAPDTAPTCGGCGNPIGANVKLAMGRSYHRECLAKYVGHESQNEFALPEAHDARLVEAARDVVAAWSTPNLSVIQGRVTSSILALEAVLSKMKPHICPTRKTECGASAKNWCAACPLNTNPRN
jgi:hypothetical protein